MFVGWNFSGGWISKEISVPGEISSDGTDWFDYWNVRTQARVDPVTF
jgi:hypothetical protein